MLGSHPEPGLVVCPGEESPHVCIDKVCRVVVVRSPDMSRQVMSHIRYQHPLESVRFDKWVEYSEDGGMHTFG